jgi:hypothetical protein
MSSTQDNASEQSQSPNASSASDGNTPASTTAASTSGASTASNTNADESLVCRWNACNQRFSTAETLYVSSNHLSRNELLVVPFFFFFFLHIYIFFIKKGKKFSFGSDPSDDAYMGYPPSHVSAWRDDG